MMPAWPTVHICVQLDLKEAGLERRELTHEENVFLGLVRRADFCPSWVDRGRHSSRKKQDEVSWRKEREEDGNVGRRLEDGRP